MGTNLNITSVLIGLGVSFTLVGLFTNEVTATIWYDSEGRPLEIQGSKITRARYDFKKVEQVNSKVEYSIIPKVLELRPELSTMNRGGFSYYHHLHLYLYRNRCFLPTYHRCYRLNRNGNSSLYLNYRSRGLSIRARY